MIFMKKYVFKITAVVLVLCLILGVAGCKKKKGTSSETETSETSSEQVSSTLSEEASSLPESSVETSSSPVSSKTETSVKPPVSSVVSSKESKPESKTESLGLPTVTDNSTRFTGTPLWTNLTYDNQGRKMGDDDGPAYAVYSKNGYNKASIDVMMNELRVNTVRKSDQKYLNAYIFLGVDIYSGDNWVNCADAGLMSWGKNQGWHLFHNIYSVSGNQVKWYESRKILDPTHNYRLVMDASKSDGWATLSVIDLSDGNKEVDSIEFQTKGSKKNGSNISMLQNYALDFPQNTKYDSSGKPSGDQWDEITLYNTNQNIYMRNLKITNAKLNDQIWTEANSKHMAMWPDKNITKINYPVVVIRSATPYRDLIIDFEMNRP